MIDEYSTNSEPLQGVNRREWVRVCVSSPGMTGISEPMPESEAEQWMAMMRIAYPEARYEIRRAESPPQATSLPHSARTQFGKF